MTDNIFIDEEDFLQKRELVCKDIWERWYSRESGFGENYFEKLLNRTIYTIRSANNLIIDIGGKNLIELLSKYIKESIVRDNTPYINIYLGGTVITEVKLSSVLPEDYVKKIIEAKG